MLRTGIVILAGMVFAVFSPHLIDSLWVSFLPLVLLICALLPAFRVIGCFLAGFLWVSLAMHWQLHQRLPEQMNNKRLVLTGEVINIPQTTPGSTKFLFAPSSFSEPVVHLPPKIKLNWRNAPELLRPGQRWRLQVKLKQPYGYQNPGGFDYQRWLFSKGIQATGYVIERYPNTLLAESSLDLDGWRLAINRHIQQHCSDCRQSGLIQALATGYRGNIDRLTRRLLQQTGTAHLIAVSGLHIGIIAAVFYMIGLWLWRHIACLQRWAQSDVAIVSSWLGGLLYSLLSGFELPAQRAMMMLTVLLMTRLLRLPLNLLHTTVAAVLLVIVFSPLAVLSTSFWLTLNALMIIVFASLLLHHGQSWLKQLVIVQSLFALLYIPISLLVFNQWHPASFLANLIAVPWVSLLIVPANFLLLLLFWLPDSWLHWLYFLLDGLLDGLVRMLMWLSSHGFGAINMPAPSAWWLLLLVIGALLALQPGRFVSRFLLLMGLPLVIFWHPRQPPLLSMAVLDVGQGTSIVLATANHTMVYDFGPGNRRSYSLGEWVVRPFLQQAGIRQLDGIILSHSDQDHIGGMYALQKDFADTLVLSGMKKDIRQKLPLLSNVHDCHHAPSWRWDGVLFEFLQTRHEATDSDNDRSCVLMVTAGAQRLLLTGDIEQLQEQRLIDRYSGQLQADILIAPHHGSMTSSSVDFIAAVAARQVIFTSGFLNRWRFPRAQVIDRYRNSGAQIHNTAHSGAIMVSCNQTECRVERYRRRHARIWY